MHLKSLREIPYVDLVFNLVHKEIRTRYFGAALGFAWSLGSPLINTLTYWVVFTWIFPNKNPNFALYLVTGNLHWMLFTQISSNSCELLTGAGGLIKKIRFPRVLIIASGLLTTFTFWLSAFAIYMVLYPLLGGTFSMAWWTYPLVLLPYLIFICGVAMFLSIGHVLFRDLKHIVDVVLPLLFWLTPIVWHVDLIHSDKMFLLNFNPLLPFIQSFSQIFVYGEIPALHMWVKIYVIAFASLAVGGYLFRSKVNKLVEIL
ncbi:ABC transporter permease [Chromobacterium sp. ATCC 53434]|nr:ABC transporter permease [Chromobacterium sp. ATCC 53434]